MLVGVVVVGPFTSIRGASAQLQMPPCSEPGQFTPHPVNPFGVNWYSVKAPRFPTGIQTITDYAVEPINPEHLYITNGSVVMRSIDSGCHWELSYDAGAGGAAVPNGQIMEIEVSAPGVVYLPVQELDPVTRPHVVVTTDGGASWMLGDGPLLNGVVGKIRDLDAGFGHAQAAMLVDVENSDSNVVSIKSGQVVFVTDTAGQAWEPRHILEGGASVGAGPTSVGVLGEEQFSSLAVNPAQPNDIWLYGENGVAHSIGQTLDDVGLGDVGLIVFSLDGTRMAAFGRTSGTADLSSDGGRSFSDLNTGFIIDSAQLAGQGLPPVRILGSLGNAYYQQGTSPPREISPIDGTTVTDVQTGLASIFARTPTSIEVTTIPEEPPPPLPSVVGALNLEEGKLDTNYLTPPSTNVVLGPGQSKTIPYHLALPAASTPLDVYFMMDISGSMGGTINGTRSSMQEIGSRLVEAGADVQFGVGSFRSFNDLPAYRRDRDIGPFDSSLASALNSLSANGGGAETQMAALKASVTGERLGSIPPNLNMHFREGSLRVAIEATDEEISQGAQHPSYDETSAALRAHDVKMVGIAIQDTPLLGEPDYENPGQPASGLQLVAEGSRAIAPAEGVDCDGDGDAEIAPGDPIVCIIDPDEVDDAGVMADAIVNVLQAIQDIQTLEATVTPVGSDGPHELIRSVEPSSFPSVDLKEAYQNDFEVSVRCPRLHKKTEFPYKVSVSRESGALATGDLTVVCKAVPVERPPSTPFIAAIFPLAAVFPPPVRPPDPVPEPNPNPQPNPQTNAQAQGAFAAQEQRQPQLALAHQATSRDAIATQMDEFNFSVRKRRTPPAPFVFAVGVMTSIFAYAMALQRARVAHARRWRQPG